MTVPIITLGWLCVTVQDLKATVRLRVSGQTLWDASILTAPLISGRMPTFRGPAAQVPSADVDFGEQPPPSSCLFPHSSVSAMYPVQPRISGAEWGSLSSGLPPQTHPELRPSPGPPDLL